MSNYEVQTIKNNDILLKQIEDLKKKLKPVENPIITKILPFLPYDVNRNILDKLDIQKQIYLLEKKFYTLFDIFIHNRFTYYTADGRYDKKSYAEETGQEWVYFRSNSLKDDISDRYDITVFDYPNDLHYEKLWEFRNRQIVNTYNSTDNYDLKKCLENMAYKFEKIHDILSDEMFEDLQPLSNIDCYRTNKIIHFKYEYFEREYKIFKSNDAINKKQFDRLIENVKSLVINYKRKIVNILNQD